MPRSIITVTVSMMVIRRDDCFRLTVNGAQSAKMVMTSTRLKAAEYDSIYVADYNIAVCAYHSLTYQENHH